MSVCARAVSCFSRVQLHATPWTPGSSVHGILQARILECVAISFSRGSSPPGDQTGVSDVSCTGRGLFTTSATWEVPPPAGSGVPGSARPRHQSMAHLSWDWVTPLISRWGLQLRHGDSSRTERVSPSASPGRNPTREVPFLCCSSSSPLSPKGGTSTTPWVVPGKL